MAIVQIIGKSQFRQLRSRARRQSGRTNITAEILLFFDITRFRLEMLGPMKFEFGDGIEFLTANVANVLRGVCI
jgi:hypothetical protein